MRFRRLKKPEGPEKPREIEGEGTGEGAEEEAGSVEEAKAAPGRDQGALERDFFELEPEDVSTWRPPGPLIAVRRERNFKPALEIMAAVAAVGLIVAVFILIWPSSVVRAPDVTGKTLSEAMETARKAGLEPRVVGWVYSGLHSDGVVLAQNPLGKKTARKGSEMTLTVSKGPRRESERLPAQAVNPGRQSTQPQSSPGPLYEKTVVIDPGHQAKPSGLGEWTDPGMTKHGPPEGEVNGTASGNPEYLYTMDIGQKLKDLLEKDGVKAVMTRESSMVDMSNVDRAELANNANADLLLSIHCANSDDPVESGMRTLYPEKNKWTSANYDRSKTAALYVQEELVKTCATNDLGIVPRGDMTLFNWSKVPVVEPEVGFLSNPGDDEMLSDEEFRWRAAHGLRNGVIEYLTSP